jgi:hypothetical protein
MSAARTPAGLGGVGVYWPVTLTLGDAGANKPGTEHGHANAKRLKLHRQPLQHGDDRELACRVGAKTEHAQKAGHGCGVDDVATFAVRADVWKEGTDAMKDSHKVDVEYPAPIVARDVVDASAGEDAGIVANHVHISECLVPRLGCTLDADRIGNVAGNTAHIRPKIVQAADGGCQRVRLDIGEHHFHARFRERPAEREPDAARSACHECSPTGKLPHDPSVTAVEGPHP